MRQDIVTEIIIGVCVLGFFALLISTNRGCVEFEKDQKLHEIDRLKAKVELCKTQPQLEACRSF